MDYDMHERKKKDTTKVHLTVLNIWKAAEFPFLLYTLLWLIQPTAEHA